jgi:hypothetical protein
MATHPADVARVALKKFVRFWNVVPNAAEFGGLYAAISAASFGPVLLFALAGLLRMRRHWRALAPMLVIVAYFSLLHTLTIASRRYRLPIEPLLIALAARAATTMTAPMLRIAPLSNGRAGVKQ